jgi:hypothetical protein
MKTLIYFLLFGLGLSFNLNGQKINHKLGNYQGVTANEEFVSNTSSEQVQSVNFSHYQYLFKVKNIVSQGDAKYFQEYARKVFDKLPSFDMNTKIFSISSTTHFHYDLLNEKFLMNGFVLSDFTVNKVKE